MTEADESKSALRANAASAGLLATMAAASAAAPVAQFQRIVNTESRTAAWRCRARAGSESVRKFGCLHRSGDMLVNADQTSRRAETNIASPLFEDAPMCGR